MNNPINNVIPITEEKKNSSVAEELFAEIAIINRRLDAIERGGGRKQKASKFVKGSTEFLNLGQIKKYLEIKGYAFSSTQILEVDFSTWTVKSSIENDTTRIRYKTMFDIVFGNDWVITYEKVQE